MSFGRNQKQPDVAFGGAQVSAVACGPDQNESNVVFGGHE
jgi:hypothetical protein